MSSAALMSLGGRGAKGEPPRSVQSVMCISGCALNRRMTVIEYCVPLIRVLTLQ